MGKGIAGRKGGCRQQVPTKIIVERHYAGTEKMEAVFRRIAEEQITKKFKEIVQNNGN